MQGAAYRIVTVDALRGVLAFGVMAYHTLHYEGVTTIPLLGTYGVYCFFVISGFSLYVAYAHKLNTPDEIWTYAARRLFRIAPLFYVALVLQAIVSRADGYSIDRVILNVSLLFGVANPGSSSLITGGWSIGIEMVFYAVFPVIVLATKGQARRLGAVAAVLIVAQVAAVNFALLGTTLAGAWVTYTQPLSFIGYFVCGCLFASVYISLGLPKGSSLAAIGATISMLCLVLINYGGSLTGWVGLLSTACAISLVVCVALMAEPVGAARQVAEFFGRVSYPVYLLHPIVYIIARLATANTTPRIALTVVGTALFAWVINAWVERPIGRLRLKLESGLN